MCQSFLGGHHENTVCDVIVEEVNDEISTTRSEFVLKNQPKKCTSFQMNEINYV